MMLMVQLMMMRMMGSDGAATKDILDEERRPASGGTVLTWLCLLLLAGGRLHLPFLVLCTQLCTRLERMFRGYILASWRPVILAKKSKTRFGKSK